MGMRCPCLRKSESGQSGSMYTIYSCINEVKVVRKGSRLPGPGGTENSRSGYDDGGQKTEGTG
jgi:hypothetical protein